MPINNSIINQKGTPAFYSDIFANRPAFGYAGRVFISTDTGAIYEDTGTSWTLIADAGAGTTGTLQQVTTNGNTTTLAIQVQGIDFSDGAGTGLYNIAIGNQTMGANTTGNNNISIGYQTLKFNTTGALNVAVGNTALVNNTTGSQNTAVGQLALNLNTTGAQNTALGNATLQNNTTGASNTAIGHASLVANTTASFNTAVGYTSMQLNTTGTNNTALGFNSLNANTTGNNNTALGLSALSGNTTASFNTAIGSSSLLNNTTGTQNVAIGYLSLSQNLVGNQNVAIGNNALQNSTASQNTAIGYSTLITNTTGANSTAVGNQALQQNTTGTQNTAIGSGALANNTTANYNTAVGTSSLGSNTTGANNTAVGLASLQINTSGSNNVGIGFASLAANTTGNNNTALGTSALNQNTTGSSNISIGYQSLYANTTGGNNTSIGFLSSQQNTTGAGNTAIGYNSFNVNTTGSNNVAIGNSALSYNTTASNNTAVGVSSLNANTTGTQNTALGINAGANITTGSGNTFLGVNSGTGITTGGNNTILGNAGTLSAALTGNIIFADGNGNTRLFSDANGLIGINQAVGSVPGGQIDIHTTQTYALVLNGLSTSNAYTAFSNASVGKWRIGNTYNAGANTFDIYNLGTSSAALSFNSTTSAATFSGNVILGNFADDGNKLQINGNAFIKSGNSLYIGNNTNSNYWGIQSAGTGATALTFQYNSGASLLSIATTGNVLIGSTTDDTINKLQVTGSGTFKKSAFNKTILGDARVIVLENTDPTVQLNSRQEIGFGYNSAYQPVVIGHQITDNTDFTNGSFYVAVRSGVTNSAPTLAFNIASTGAATFTNLAGTGSRAVLADASGLLSAPVSDISVKENIKTIEYGLSEILKMNPVWFNYIDEYKNYGEGRQNGNIAQEMESIIPEAVFTTPSTGKMGINYDQLHAVYIKAIQELKAEIDALKNN